jgi:uncharacterized protein (DUF488 family)
MHPVIGIGYQDLEDPDALVAQLRERRVHTLVDVRKDPPSQHGAFTGGAVAIACNDAGIVYRHEPALGNPDWNRKGFARPGPDRDEARGHMFDRLADAAARAALNRIWTAVHTGPVALLCREADEHACHRRVILERLDEYLEVELAPTPPTPAALFDR